MILSQVIGTVQRVVPSLFFAAWIVHSACQQEQPSFPRSSVTQVHEVDGFNWVEIPRQLVQVGHEGAVPFDEQPVYTEEVLGFYVLQTEVTNAQFAQFMNARQWTIEQAIQMLGFKGNSVRPTQILNTGTRFRAALGRDDYPVSTVTYDGANAFCGSLGGRLPTESEWVAAASGGVSQLYPWGAEPDSNRAHVGETWRGHMPTLPVKSFEPNAYGLYDVMGNVWEWTSSRYAPYGTNDWKKDGKERRVLRGGDWYTRIEDINLFTRYALEPHVRGLMDGGVGFRCVRTSL